MSASEGGRREASCIFCRIVAGEIPANKVYEDDRVLAFLDVGPLSQGHTLIIPKEHYARLDEMPGELAGACVAVGPAIARAVMAVTGAKDFNLLQNNGALAHQEVGHVHFHVIPKTEDAGLGIEWPKMGFDAEEGKRLREAVAKRIQNSK